MSQEPVVKGDRPGTCTGSSAVLDLKDVDQPVLGDGDVLVRVRAAAEHLLRPSRHDRTVGHHPDHIQPSAHPAPLALVVIPLDIPPGPTAPNQTALSGNAAQPGLARPYWTVESRSWAVIS
jgi:hypothetical protein